MKMLAQKHKVWLSLGGFVRKVENQNKFLNSHIILDDDGQIKAIYNKLHLFNISSEG